jgi:UDP-N-acetylmuramate--alanine ligase
VEYDHPDFYPNPQSFYKAFQEFVERIDAGGILFACGDDQGASRLLKYASDLDIATYSYGLWSIQYSYFAYNLIPSTYGGYSFDAFRGEDHLANITLKVPGEHNVCNAIAVVAIADQLGLSMVETAQALSEFSGVGRRFDIRGEVNGVVVVDDYAHHPTEIRATLTAARARFPERKMWVVWQPHTYSRTKTLLNDFSKSFENADHLVVTNVYPAREAMPSNFSANQIEKAIRHSDVHFASDLTDAASYLLESLRPGDVLLVLSAGDAYKISNQVLEDYQGH